MMTEQTLGTTTITQVGIIVQDIEAKARAWAEAIGYKVEGVYRDAGISGSRASNRAGVVCSSPWATIEISLILRLEPTTSGDRRQTCGRPSVSPG